MLLTQGETVNDARKPVGERVPTGFLLSSRKLTIGTRRG
jgi:hypothetical protein